MKVKRTWDPTVLRSTMQPPSSLTIADFIMAKKKRLGDTNPATEIIRKCLFDVKNDPNNTFSFHKPEGVNWNFDLVYKRLQDKHPNLWQEYGRPDTARLRQFFKNEITKYNTEQGERGTRPGEYRRVPPSSFHSLCMLPYRDILHLLTARPIQTICVDLCANRL